MRDTAEALEPGAQIRGWREARGLSQLRVALVAGVSARHLSFVESGRARPGRQVLVRIGRALELSLRDQNQLLECAGFAPLHPRRRVGDADLAAVTSVFRFLLDRHEPFSAVVIDRGWNVVMHNTPHVTLMRRFAPGSMTARGEPANLILEAFDPASLRPAIANFALVGHILRDRVELACMESPSFLPLRGLLDRIDAFGPLPSRPSAEQLGGSAILLPIELRRGADVLSLFTTTTRVTAPLDATVQDLELETFFPADRASEVFFAGLTPSPDRAEGDPPDLEGPG